MTQKLWFVFHENQLLLIKKKDQLSIPVSLPQELDDPSAFIGLGNFEEGLSHGRTLVNKPTFSSEEYHWVTLKQTYECLGEKGFSLAARAHQILQWNQNHCFCGRCGKETVRTPELFERKCVNCQLFFYPRISPSIIVRIKKDNKILMARSAHFAPGIYGLIAGFVEPGESLEEAVMREVKEETSLSIKNILYFASQPWPFPDSLIVAFTADYESGELKLDEKELEAAGWYGKDEMPGRPSFSFSIAQKLIDHFLETQS